MTIQLTIRTIANDNFSSNKERLLCEIKENIFDLRLAIIALENCGEEDVKFFADLLEIKRKAGESDEALKLNN